MRFLIEPLIVVGCTLAGAGFYLILWAIMEAGAREDESMARIRAADDEEQLAHIRRFSAAMNVLDMQQFRERKANAPATVQASREASEGQRPGEQLLATEVQHG